jgi:H+/Cl- antiporter ClcA
MLQRILLPGLLAAGIGQLVFTGVAGWAGVHETELAVPGLPQYGSVRVADIALCVVVAILTAVLVLAARRLGSLSFHRIGGRLPVLVGGGFAVGLIALIFRALADKPVDLVLFSGELAIPSLLAQTSAAVVIGILVAKALGYAISIGAGFRGGPVFPSLFIGVGVGVLMTVIFSGFSITPAVAAGVAAGAAAALRTPFTGALLGSLLVGAAGINTIPLAIIAAVVAWLIALAASGSVEAQPETPSEAPAGAAAQPAGPPPNA